MRASVVIFPGSNCDRDVAVVLEAVTGSTPNMVWHGDSELPESDLIVLPGGFSYGDYLRSGALAAHSPIIRAVVAAANKGVAVLGICNGFQILTESQLLPGVMMRNASLKYICRDVHIRVEQSGTPFTTEYSANQPIVVPVAHKDGNYFADEETLDRLEDEGQIAFRYCDASGMITDDANPNGSQRNIAGVYDKTSRILGMMP
ncbi:MAG: phosphoribosylformylglycinamidine synthase subunit PurQ, partial [Alphaproteobacteria bacterium]